MGVVVNLSAHRLTKKAKKLPHGNVAETYEKMLIQKLLYQVALTESKGGRK